MTQRRRSKGTGTTRQLASGRWQARFLKHPAPMTFDTKLDASAWLKAQARLVERGAWVPPTREVPDSPSTTVGEYAATWLAERTLKPRTREHYARLADRFILPAFGSRALDEITPAMVRAWHASLDETKPTQRAHTYSLLKAVLATAVADELIVIANPCRIRGAGQAKTVHRPKIATLPELDAIVEAMPPRLRVLVLLSSWCCLRFGEVAELRRRDVDVEGQVLRISRAVVFTGGQVIVGAPKSSAGRRTVSIPSSLMPAIVEHLQRHTGAAQNALLFPAGHGGHLAPNSVHGPFRKAKAAAGRPDLTLHDLRHTGATLAAATGASLATLQARLGHSTVGAAMRYQHASAEGDKAIADRLSEMLSASA